MIYNEYFAVTKPGNCPVPNTELRCIQCLDACQADTDCPNRQKCCPSNQCGNGCSDPDIGMSLHYFYITYRNPINKVKNVSIFKIYASQYKI